MIEMKRQLYKVRCSLYKGLEYIESLPAQKGHPVHWTARKSKGLAMGKDQARRVFRFWRRKFREDARFRVVKA
jgi:hypothetical protein